MIIPGHAGKVRPDKFSERPDSGGKVGPDKFSERPDSAGKAEADAGNLSVPVHFLMG